MIAVEASDEANIPDDPVFRWTAHHVKEIFLALLPKAFVLDGSSKLQITCGPTGMEPQYKQVLGTTNYFQEDFDFASYYNAAPQEREQVIAQLLQKAMIDIATKAPVGADAVDVISSTIHAMEERGFNLKLHSRKLSKSNRRQKLKVNVYRNLNRELGEVWSCEVLNQDKTRIHEEWMGETPHYLDLTDFYRSSEWIGDIFVVRNRLGKVVYEFNAPR